MQQQHLSNSDDDKINFHELLEALIVGKWILIVTTLLFTTIVTYYALSLPNVYQSEVTLSPASEGGGLNISGQLGGLAALAGVSIGDKGGDKTTLAIEILKSREFLGRFINDHDLYVPIVAASGWDRENDELLINPSIYNKLTKEWVREVKEPFKAKPSILETIELFEKKMTVSQDKTTGIVKISVEYFSPKVAKDWVDNIVKSINEEMRNKDISEAEKSIKYLKKQLDSTNVSEIRTMLFALIEEQTKKLMLANARTEYIFKTVDKAVIAEKKSKPARALIVILGFIVGMLIATLLIVVRYYKTK